MEINLDEYIGGLDKIILAKIREVREEGKISRKTLSEDLGIATSTYADLENGKINFDIKRLLAVLKYLGIDDIFKKKSEEKETQLQTINDFEGFLTKFQEQSSDVKGLKEDMETIKQMITQIAKKVNETKEE
jgi:transcriptional regulator with XRE-family HTH domain